MSVKESTEESRGQSEPSTPRKILVAVADGGLSDAAVEFGGALAELAAAQLDLLPATNLPPTPSHGTIVEDVRKLRATGQNEEADTMLKAFEELYRDRADTADRIRAAREAGVPKP